MAGLWGLPDRLSYCASKFGAVGLTSALAIDMKPYNVAVNSICRGAVDTPLTAYSKPDVASQMNLPKGCCFNPRCPHAIAICTEIEPEFREIYPAHYCACRLVSA